MRYLIFGDVHGNLPALEKMLDEEKENYDSLICHGDVVNYGPWSNECVDLLKDLNCTCLKGNHEDYFLQGFYPGENILVQQFFEHSYINFLKKDVILSYLEFFDIPGYQIIHTINNQYFFPDTDFSTVPVDRNYILGHSHYQFEKNIKNFKLFNTGSVGQNRKFINLANYLIVDLTTEKVELKSTKYNVDVVIDEMRSKGYPTVCLEYYQKKERV